MAKLIDMGLAPPDHWIFKQPCRLYFLRSVPRTDERKPGEGEGEKSPAEVDRPGASEEEDEREEQDGEGGE